MFEVISHAIYPSLSADVRIPISYHLKRYIMLIVVTQLLLYFRSGSPLVRSRFLTNTFT